jgi:glutathione S-transferase
VRLRFALSCVRAKERAAIARRHLAAARAAHAPKHRSEGDLDMSTSPRFELLYFPIHGRAEQIRLLLHYTGTAFADTGVTDWPALKGKTPLGQLPILIDRSGGAELVIPQSAAIMRHLARTLGAYGENEHEHVLTDVLAETAQDVRAKFVPVAFAARYNPPADSVEKYWSEVLPHNLQLLEKLLSRSTKPEAGFFVGAKPTYADLMVFDLLDGHLSMKPASLDAHPALKAFHARIAALPTLSGYLATRRPSELRAS